MINSGTFGILELFLSKNFVHQFLTGDVGVQGLPGIPGIRGEKVE